MKNILLTLVFVVTISTFMQAQTTSDANGILVPISFAGDLRKIVTIRPEEQIKEVKGSVYLYKDFVLNGIVSTTKGETFNINNMNIDLKNQEFVAKYARDSIFVFSNLSKVQIINTQYFKSGGQIYTILFEGNNFSILKNMKKILKDAVINKMNGLTVSPARWYTEIKYFKFNNDQEHPKIIEIKLNKNNLLKLIAVDKQKNIKSFIKNNSYSFKNENDVKKIFNYYNSLL